VDALADRKRIAVALAVAALVVAVAVAAPAAAVPASGHSTAHASAYCSSIPRVEVQKEEWGFHAGQPSAGRGTSYARGHGKIDLGASTATGIMCQVDRMHDDSEHQVILTIGRKVIYTSHHAVMFGVEGNVMKIHVTVTSSTDAQCAAGTHGVVTIFASYNNIHEDLVQFWFPPACKDHRHRYTGGSVVTNVPPN
jgi:hypothetical protein